MSFENYFYWVIVPILAVSVILVFVRFLKGPSMADRVIALDMLFLVSICIIAIFSMLFDQSTFLDIAMLFALIAFFSTTVYAYYIEQKNKR
ncbi:Na(+) H(+) antiporter subunit F [Mariniradius saccharolyticus AK6]|uniref:Na(+) H(+) antiporter subunit F n=1 Tax=Mariniradius saccharolyticus AK6 TaxID=1239962 RepID=M7XK70_9BACT|nr:monovalent cation/H+ antiporter complex subunit F [Mariniradius saccharolyticus]EMS35264.1 Na(+) H(+) antiporter subunit F [Mariniradius saccharolyticus AK6]